jgi:hypothetical protein
MKGQRHSLPNVRPDRSVIVRRVDEALLGTRLGSWGEGAVLSPFGTRDVGGVTGVSGDGAEADADAMRIGYSCFRLGDSQYNCIT